MGIKTLKFFNSVIILGFSCLALNSLLYNVSLNTFLFRSLLFLAFCYAIKKVIDFLATIDTRNL